MSECLQCCPANCNCGCHGDSGKSEWISVKERLPASIDGYSKKVLVCSSLSYDGPEMEVDYYNYYKGEWNRNPDATHWRPLPEPPNDTTLTPL